MVVYCYVNIKTKLCNNSNTFYTFGRPTDSCEQMPTRVLDELNRLVKWISFLTGATYVATCQLVRQYMFYYSDDSKMSPHALLL